MLAGLGAVTAARPAGAVTWRVERVGGRTDPFVTAMQETLWARHGLAVRCVDGAADVAPSDDGVVWRVVQLGVAAPAGLAVPDTLAGLLRFARDGGAVALPRPGSAASLALLHQSLWEMDVGAAAAWHRAMRDLARPGGAVIADGAALQGFAGGSVTLTYRAAAVRGTAAARALMRLLPVVGRRDGDWSRRALPMAPRGWVDALLATGVRLGG